MDFPSPNHVLVIIPAYNEASNLQVLLPKVQAMVPFDIVVVNDGSTDGTSEVARLFHVPVLDLPCNLGIGGAVQTGYKYAWQNGYKFAVQLDADGQHPPEQIERILEPVRSGEADLCIGSRYVAKSAYRSSLTRRSGMLWLSSLVSLLTGERRYDTTSGFRAVNRSVMALFSRNYPVDYPEVEVLVLLKKNGFRICEVPVEMKPRLAGKSSITPLKSVEYMCKVSFALLIQMLRREPR